MWRKERHLLTCDIYNYSLYCYFVPAHNPFVWDPDRMTTVIGCSNCGTSWKWTQYGYIGKSPLTNMYWQPQSVCYMTTLYKLFYIQFKVTSRPSCNRRHNVKEAWSDIMNCTCQKLKFYNFICSMYRRCFSITVAWYNAQTNNFHIPPAIYDSDHWLLRRKSKLSTSNKLLIYKTILKTNLDLRNTTLGYGFHFQHRKILERFQSKALRMIVDAPWYVPNTVIRRDLQIPTGKEEIRRYSSQYSARLSAHTNDLIVNLVELPDNRRLQRHLPNDLPTRFLM
jgi:carbonic anhydrase